MKTKVAIMVLVSMCLVACKKEDKQRQRVTDLEAELQRVRSELLETRFQAAEEKKRGDEWFAQSENLAKQVVQLRRAIGDQKESYDKLLPLYEKRGEVNAISRAANEAKVQLSQQLHMPSGMSRSSVASEPPGWRYPPIHEAKEYVKKEAKAKWGENYRMVEHEITKQMEAYDLLKKYEGKKWSDPALRRQINAAGQKWGNNYNMVLYELESQLDSKSRLGQ